LSAQKIHESMQVIENNKYGMGTSTAKAASNPDFYTPEERRAGKEGRLRVCAYHYTNMCACAYKYGMGTSTAKTGCDSGCDTG